MICRACKGAGGFNRFIEVPASGTSTQTLHEWVPCSLCCGSGQELAPVITRDAPVRRFTGVTPGLEQQK